MGLTDDFFHPYIAVLVYRLTDAESLMVAVDTVAVYSIIGVGNILGCLGAWLADAGGLVCGGDIGGH